MRLQFDRSRELSLGLSLSDIKQQQEPKKPKLFIASLSYDARFEYEFVSSLTKTLRVLWSTGIESEVYYCNNDPFPGRARSMLIEKFLETDCTHFLTIDADQGWDENKVPEMLEHDLPIICGAVPIKDPAGENYLLRIFTNWDQTPMVDEKGLIETELIGAAFMMIRRDTFLKFRQFHPDRTCKSISPNFYWYFKEETIGEVFWGEDMSFCRLCGEAGIKIKIMPDINIRHVGKKTWSGNYHEYLLGQPQPKFNDTIRMGV